MCTWKRSREHKACPTGEGPERKSSEVEEETGESAIAS